MVLECEIIEVPPSLSLSGRHDSPPIELVGPQLDLLGQGVKYSVPNLNIIVWLGADRSGQLLEGMRWENVVVLLGSSCRQTNGQTGHEVGWNILWDETRRVDTGW